jgi:hypothetical protein
MFFVAGTSRCSFTRPTVWGGDVFCGGYVALLLYPPCGVGVLMFFVVGTSRCSFTRPTVGRIDVFFVVGRLRCSFTRPVVWGGDVFSWWVRRVAPLPALRCGGVMFFRGG